MTDKQKELFIELKARYEMQEAVLQKLIKRQIEQNGISWLLENPKTVPLDVLVAVENLDETQKELSQLYRLELEEERAKR